MRRRDTVGELIRVLYAENWMTPHLLGFAEVKAPLQELMNERVNCTRRTKHVAKQRPLRDEHWATGRVRAWEATRRLLNELAQLCSPKPEWGVPMFLDASDLLGVDV